MILKQIYLGCLAQASYLIGDETTGHAAVVDPRRDVDDYLEDAGQLGLEIRHVFLTHFHADFVSGHLELRERTGADIRMGSRAAPDYPFVPMTDGDVLQMGAVRFQVLETPGHTPESICILVTDTEAASDHPQAVLTGDTLFIGDVGRPDLMASVGMSAQELAGALYDSTREKLLTLPDATLVYPGHGAGSMCGKNLSTDTVSTIGEQRRMNIALQPMDKDAFVHLVTDNQPTAPSYFAFDADLNRRQRGTLEASLKQALTPLAPEAFLARVKEGAQVLDARDPDDYARAFLPGSINIGLGGTYATWAGTVLDRDRPLVLIADAGREQEAAVRLGRIGFDHVDGVLEGGLAALDPSLLTSVRRVQAVELARIVGEPGGPLVLDVRNPGEHEQMRIRGSLHIPLNQLAARFGDVPPDREIVVQCAAGYRSSIAASMLRGQGFERVTDLVGGIGGWRAAGLALEEVPAGA